MSVYACELCGYEYRPKAGDPDNTPDGDKPADLPEDSIPEDIDVIESVQVLEGSEEAV